MVPGHGLLQCAIYDHMSAGMSAIYKVRGRQNRMQRLGPP
jgi:hypothetical protein